MFVSLVCVSLLFLIEKKKFIFIFLLFFFFCSARDLLISYICHGCLCCRCTRARNDQQPDVVLLCWVLLMQVWPNTIYYWGGFCSAAPTDGGPCSAGTLTLASAWCTGVQLTKLLGGQIRLLAMNGFNLGIRLVSTDPILGGKLARWTKR